MPVVDPHNGLQVGEQPFRGQEGLQGRPDVGRPAHAAADNDLETCRAIAATAQEKADVVHLRSRTVMRRGRHCDLEFPGQKGKLGVQARPLADGFAPNPGVFQFIRRSSRIGICRDISDAVATGLNGVEVCRRQHVQDFGSVRQPDPVELDVGAGGEVSVSPVKATGDVRERTHLAGIQGAVRHCDPEHVGVELQVETIHKPEGLELVLGKLAGEPAADLIPEFSGAVRQHGAIDGIVTVHAVTYFRRMRLTRPEDRAAPCAWRRASTASPPSACLPWRSWLLGPRARIRSR